MQTHKSWQKDAQRIATESIAMEVPHAFACVDFVMYLSIHMYMLLCILIFMFLFILVVVYVCICIHIYIYILSVYLVVGHTQFKGILASRQNAPVLVLVFWGISRDTSFEIPIILGGSWEVVSIYDLAFNHYLYSLQMGSWRGGTGRDLMLMHRVLVNPKAADDQQGRADLKDLMCLYMS